MLAMFQKPMSKPKPKAPEEYVTITNVPKDLQYEYDEYAWLVGKVGIILKRQAFSTDGNAILVRLITAEGSDRHCFNTFWFWKGEYRKPTKVELLAALLGADIEESVNTK